MRKIFGAIFILLFVTANVSAQISISSAKYNALKEIKKIPEGMTYKEFQKIQRQLDWKKIFVAAILPGYIHFYADYEKTAWVILGTRLITGAMMGYALVDEYKLTKDIDLGVLIDSSDKSARTERNSILFATGLILNVAAYAFDWAHGDWIIETERNRIYFKYGLDKGCRKALGFSYNTRLNVPGLTFSINF